MKKTTVKINTPATKTVKLTPAEAAAKHIAAKAAQKQAEKDAAAAAAMAAKQAEKLQRKNAGKPVETPATTNTAEENKPAEMSAVEKLAMLLSGYSAEDIIKAQAILPDAKKAAIKQAAPKPAKEPVVKKSAEEKKAEVMLRFVEACRQAGVYNKVINQDADLITDTNDVKVGDYYIKADGLGWACIMQVESITASKILTLRWALDDGKNPVGSTGAWAWGQWAATGLNYTDPKSKSNNYTGARKTFCVFRNK